MHFKNLLGSIARVGFCIPISDFYLRVVLHGLRCQKSTLMNYCLINQSINLILLKILTSGAVRRGSHPHPGAAETVFEPLDAEVAVHMDRTHAPNNQRRTVRRTKSALETRGARLVSSKNGSSASTFSDRSCDKLALESSPASDSELMNVKLRTESPVGVHNTVPPAEPVSTDAVPVVLFRARSRTPTTVSMGRTRRLAIRRKYSTEPVSSDAGIPSKHSVPTTHAHAAAIEFSNPSMEESHDSRKNNRSINSGNNDSETSSAFSPISGDTTVSSINMDSTLSSNLSSPPTDTPNTSSSFYTPETSISTEFSTTSADDSDLYGEKQYPQLLKCSEQQQQSYSFPTKSDSDRTLTGQPSVHSHSHKNSSSKNHDNKDPVTKKNKKTTKSHSMKTKASKLNAADNNCNEKGSKVKYSLPEFLQELEREAATHPLPDSHQSSLDGLDWLFSTDSDSSG